MFKFSLLFISLLVFSNAYTQTFDAGFKSLAGTNGQIPFWIWANQLGRYTPTNSTLQNFELNADYSYQFIESDFSFETKASLDFTVAEQTDIRFTELYGGLNWKFLQIKLGAFSEKERYNGISASNGNLAYSRNARPHPRIRLGFNRYVQLIPNWLSVYGFYEEGLLNDKRYVDKTHLHYKAFYVRVGNGEALEFTAGLNHFVMWGGTHPVYGELPAWSDYFGYVMGGAGGSNALQFDQNNVLGNSYGTYQVEISKHWAKFRGSFYFSHPFDDSSGMELDNWRDNLYGLFIQINKANAFVKGFAVEYYYIKNQSGNYHLELQPDGTKKGRGLDDYFNHGVYCSGVSYQQMAMTSPLFTPLILTEGMSLGFANTSFSGLHLGANGFISEQLQWKAMLTHTINFGRKRSGGTLTYTPSRKQLSSLVQLNYQFKNAPISVGTSLALDKGTLFDEGENTTRLGGMFSLKWHIVD